MFTYHYMQPDEYRFSLDSIELAKYVAYQMQAQKDLESLRVLDLCAGCGVIGFELAWHLKTLRQIDFIEVQDIYTDYFHQNIAIVNRPELQSRWHLTNYDALLKDSWKNQFDLIISNPPYFQAGHGTLSPSTFKNRCRFYLDSSFSNFILAMVNSLAEGGVAYFLLRPAQQRRRDLFSETQKLILDAAVSAAKVASIRGNNVILLRKNS